jgi:hypothetical protein
MICYQIVKLNVFSFSGLQSLVFLGKSQSQTFMKSQYSVYAGALLALLLNSCIKDHPPQVPVENASAFTEIASIDLGGAAASEISAYDPATKKIVYS